MRRSDGNERETHPLFGINVDPSTNNLEEAFNRAMFAGRAGFDLFTIQDHPYNMCNLETWTLLIYGNVEDWVDRLVSFYRDFRQDTFIFWLTAGDEMAQLEVYAHEVLPAVREQLSSGV